MHAKKHAAGCAVPLFADHQPCHRLAAAGLRLALSLSKEGDNEHQAGDQKENGTAQSPDIPDTRHDKANRRQREAIPFYGIVYAHQLRVPIGAAIHDLDLLAKTGGPADFWNTLYFLPL